MKEEKNENDAFKITMINHCDYPINFEISNKICT